MAKSPNKTKQPQGACIFCNGTGLSKEHIWSDWLKIIIPPNSAHGNAQAGAWIDPRYQKLKWTKLPKEESRQGSVISRKVRNVCKACNNGWMSEVVNEAKPVLKRLASGQSLRLMGDDKSRLVAWLALSTIMQEFANPSAHVILAADRQFLMENKLPPEKWSIWIGRYIGENWNPFGHIHVPMTYTKRPQEGEHSSDSPPRFLLQMTSFAICGTLVHVFTSTLDSRIHRYREFVRDRKWNLNQLWPALGDGMDWPPAKSITDEELELIISGWVQSESGLDEVSCARLLNRSMDRAMNALRALKERLTNEVIREKTE